VALQRPWQPSSMSFGHLPGAFLDFFSWFQKATLGTRLPLNASRRPRLPLNPSRRPWRPSSMSFGHLPGAFLEIFSWFQKATLAPESNACHRNLGILVHKMASRKLTIHEMNLWAQKPATFECFPHNQETYVVLIKSLRSTELIKALSEMSRPQESSNIHQTYHPRMF